MARLIDADALDKMLADAQTECKRNGGNFRFGVLSNVRENIANVPTINAIPVEWLQAKITELRAMGEYQNDCANSIWFVVRLWEKEQEAGL